jgi:hypothetical protein
MVAVRWRWSALWRAGEEEQIGEGGSAAGGWLAEPRCATGNGRAHCVRGGGGGAGGGAVQLGLRIWSAGGPRSL